MNSIMSVVLARAVELGLKTEPRDQRTLYVSGRPCQVIPARWYENFPHCKAMTMYMPRTDFADFLLYAADGIVYVIPRGCIAHDTAWAESALEPYKEAWKLLNETAPALFERKTKPLSRQLQTVIAHLEKRSLSYDLVPTKKSSRRTDYRMYMQRRIVIEGRRCAIFTANLLSEDSHPWPTAHFRTSTDRWAEIFLFIVEDDIYVIPRKMMPYQTTLDLGTSRIYDYRNSWCVLGGIEVSMEKPSTPTEKAGESHRIIWEDDKAPISIVGGMKPETRKP